MTNETAASSIGLPKRRIRLAPELWAGLGIVGAITLASLYGTFFSAWDPFAISDVPFGTPGGEHWLGTDNIGRDTATRLFIAAGTSLLISASATVLAAVVGTTLGLFAGYGPGWADNLIMRACDVVLAIPAILVALMVRVIIGPGMLPLIIAMGIVYAPTFARVMRAPVLALRERDFITAAEIAGTPKLLIAVRHLLPNAMTPLMVQAAITASEVVILEAGLSYLGQGVQPPNPSAGLMISDFQKYLQTEPLLVLLPAGWNLIADGLQSMLSPRRGDNFEFLLPTKFRARLGGVFFTKARRIDTDGGEHVSKQGSIR